MVLECIPDYKKIEYWTSLSEKYGLAFEYNDFFRPEVMDDKALMEKIAGIYCSCGRSVEQDTMHGAFLDICINSHDSLIREASAYRVEMNLDLACRMGLRAVVFHTNYIVGFKSANYRMTWVDRNEAFWRQMCGKYSSINIYLENMFDESPVLLASLAERLADVMNFGVCLDISHAGLFGAGVDAFVDSLYPYVRHIHINDTDGLEDCHLAVGDGVTDWQILKSARLMQNNPSVLIEVNEAEKLLKSINYLQERIL